MKKPKSKGTIINFKVTFKERDEFTRLSSKILVAKSKMIRHSLRKIYKLDL